MALTRNTTSIAKETTGDSTTFVTGSNTQENKVLKWDSSGNAISSGYGISNDLFGGNLPSSTIIVPTQASINKLINSRLGTADGSQLGRVEISSTNNPAAGGGGLSISDKANGVQTITYTPPEILTAEQIDNTGFDAGEFAAFNADGNLVTSDKKISLVIDSSSTNNTLPTSKATFEYGQDIEAKRLRGLSNLDNTNDGGFLVYDDASKGFELSTSSETSHKLFSPTHTDVKSNVTPSYGDSMFYDGNEWTVGNFGNWGADMEYRPISGASGTTFSNLTWANLEVSNITTHAGAYYDRYFSLPVGERVVNLKNQTTPQSGVFTPYIHDLGSINYSNDSHNPNRNNYSRIGFGSWYNNYGENESVHSLQCSIQFPLAGLTGTGLVNSKIRGLYIRVHNWMAASSSDRKTSLYISYPDGSKKPLSEFVRKRDEGEEAQVKNDHNQVLLVPINEGQSQIEIDCDLNRHTAEGIEFEIIGALCTKRIELSPEVDHIQIVGSQDHLVSNTGYVDETTGSYADQPAIWTSEAPSPTGATDWSGVFPIVIPDNVYKTVIRATNSWNQANSSHEESDHITITIDWNEETIVGTSVMIEHITGIGFLYSDNLVGEKEFTSEDTGFDVTIKFELNGRSIVKLPCPAHLGTYYNPSQKYTIENYKTIASTTRKLETGYTTVGTTGTADTDGYLIVTGLFDVGANIDGFKVTIGTEVFLNDNYGYAGMVGRETMTLPIAAGESWSVEVGDDATVPLNISFDVRFKAKSTEISDSNSFNLIDSGATGSIDVGGTFIELDLSPIVGTNKTLVVMEVFGGSGSTSDNVWLKTNGSSITSYDGDSYVGAGATGVVIASNGGGATVTVMTDANGKVAIKGRIGGTVYYKVQAYQGVVSAPNGAIAYTGGESTTLPNGLIMKFGSTSSTTLNYGTAFPTGTLSVTVTGQTPFHDDIGNAAFVTNTSASGFTIGHTHTTGPGPWFWQAIGH